MLNPQLDLKEIIRFLYFSEYNKSPIRINVYPTHSNDRLVTANCARVKNSNVLSENGILHETDSVVVPATEDVQSIIKNHPQLTHFKKGKTLYCFKAFFILLLVLIVGLIKKVVTNCFNDTVNTNFEPSLVKSKKVLNHFKQN